MPELGVASALVVENRDPSGTGRVAVRYPWHDRPQDTHWARVATPMAGRGRGIYFLPELGDEVLVAFERGDVRFPCVVGALWSAVDKPPETNDDGRNDLRVIRTRGGHTLAFDDGAHGSVRLELDDGKRLSIDDNSITLQDQSGNGLTIQAESGAITLQSVGELRLKAAQISLESSGAIEIRSASTLTLAGALVQESTEEPICRHLLLASAT